MKSRNLQSVCPFFRKDTKNYLTSNNADNSYYQTVKCQITSSTCIKYVLLLLEVHWFCESTEFSFWTALSEKSNIKNALGYYVLRKSRTCFSFML